MAEAVIDWRDLPPVSEEDQPTVPDVPSQTFLKHHDRCDRAAMLYLRHRAGAGSHELNRGAIWHDVAARLTRYAIKKGEPRIGSPEVGKDFLLEYLDENPQLQVSAVERDALRYMISNFCVGEFWVPNKVLAVETTFTLEIGGYRIIGRIDRADDRGGGELEVVDYKTSFNMPDSEEFKPQTFDDEGNPRFAGDFQTMLYALGLAYGIFDDGLPLGGGYDRYRLRLAYPRYLYPEGLGKREVVVTQQQILDFRLDVEHQLRRLTEVNIAKRKWQPTPGTHCRECPAEYECPLPRILRPESQHANLTSIDDLEKAGTAWLFMAKRATNLKSRIKKAAERIGDEHPELLELPSGDRGVYIGSDLALIFIPTETEKIKDKTALREAIEETRYGKPVDPNDHFTYSSGVSFDKRKVAPRPNGGNDE